jgi:hypothetical protein
MSFRSSSEAIGEEEVMAVDIGELGIQEKNEPKRNE